MSGDTKQIDVTPEKNGGVLKEILVEGTGDFRPPKGVKVTVHYVGKLTDGKQFDSSRDRGEPFEFSLGRGNVIKGWDVGVATMKKGEKCLLTCREDYAYGSSGSPPSIPPKATLIFEVELLDWEPEDLSGKSNRGIVRHVKYAGTGVDSPKDFANVEVTLVGTLPDDKEFFNEKLSFCIGEGSKLNIPRGVEKALKHMVKEERSRIDLKSIYAFGAEGNSKLGVPPDTDVSYMITLHNFEIFKDPWIMSNTEKLERAVLFKEKGTKYLKDNDYKIAVKMYNKVIDITKFDGGFDGDEEEERKKLILAAYLNLSMTQLKLGDMVQCKDMCNKALKEDPKSVKALFRRGQAYLGMSEPQLAIKDFKAVLEIEPDNKAAASQVVICQQRSREIKANEKKIYANMFEKFARKDRECIFGWWDKNRPIVDEIKMDVEKEIAEAMQKEKERKKKFIEMKLKEKEEREKLEKEQQENEKLNEQNDPSKNADLEEEKQKNEEQEIVKPSEQSIENKETKIIDNNISKQTESQNIDQINDSITSEKLTNC